MPDFDLLDPEIVFEDDILPDHAGETYRGHEGLARATRTWLQPYEEFTIELEEIVGSGERLVSTHRFRARARHTGDKRRVALRLCVDVPGRKGDPPPVVSRSRASPRSRRAAGVGDVAAERGGGCHAVERWNSGDDTGALESLAPDVEVHHNIRRGTPLEGIYRGHAECGSSGRTSASPSQKPDSTLSERLSTTASCSSSAPLRLRGS